MKKKALFFIFLILLLVAVPVSAKAKEPVGEQINIWYSPPATFPAGEPFHIKHGWLLLIPDETPIGAWEFQLDLDGVYLPADYINREVVNHDPLTMLKQSVFNFPAGLTGTHTFTGHWLGPCQDLVDAGLHPGPCARPNESVEYYSVSATIDFIPSP